MKLCSLLLTCKQNVFCVSSVLHLVDLGGRTYEEALLLVQTLTKHNNHVVCPRANPGDVCTVFFDHERDEVAVERTTCILHPYKQPYQHQER